MVDFLFLLVFIFYAGIWVVYLHPPRNDYLIEGFAPLLVLVAAILVLYGAGRIMGMIANV